MKKILLSFLMLITAVGTYAQTNLIKNGDFEEWNFMSGTPKDWTVNMSAWTNKSTDAQSGDYSVELESSDNGVGFISSAKFNIEAGKTYSYSFYYKITGGTLTKFEANLRYFVIYPEYLTSQNVAYPAAEWTKAKFTYTATESREIDLQFLFWTSDKAKVLIDNVTFGEESALGMATEDAKQMISVYPNPATDFITIEGGADVVEFYSLSGQLVKRANIAKGNTIEVSSLENGLYILSISKDGKVSQSKFTKK